MFKCFVNIRKMFIAPWRLWIFPASPEKQKKMFEIYKYNDTIIHCFAIHTPSRCWDFNTGIIVWNLHQTSIFYYSTFFLVSFFLCFHMTHDHQTFLIIELFEAPKYLVYFFLSYALRVQLLCFQGYWVIFCMLVWLVGSLFGGDEIT